MTRAPNRARLLRRLGLLCCAVACSLAPLARAYADGPTGTSAHARAQAHLDRGIAAYAAKQYEQAIEEFSAAYAIDPRPDVLFAWAQAERLSGDCPSAMTLYHRFLSTDPTPAERQQATEQLARCERAVAASPEPTPPRAPSSSAPAPATAPAAAPSAPPRAARPPADAAASTRRSPWYTDALGDALVVAGAGALGVGVGFLIAAEASDEAAQSAAHYSEFLRHIDDENAQRVVGAIGVAAGATLLTIGVVRFLTRPAPAAREPRLSFSVERSAAVLRLSTGF